MTRAANWITNTTNRHGVTILRMSLGIVFVWFGALKLVPGLSPAEGLASETILALTGGLLHSTVSVPLLGAIETAIGIGLLTGFAMRPVLGILILHLCGTLTPLFLFPDQMFVRIPFVLTLEAQYILKNFVLISSALVIAAASRQRAATTSPEHTVSAFRRPNYATTAHFGYN